ncbi:MAG: hypothetical protein IPG22_06170 [Acidobacteria bacterium]|nr:hypothetical protein [Acidobacteriota bacterium]
MNDKTKIISAVFAGYLSAIMFTDTGETDQPAADAEFSDLAEFKAMAACADFLVYCADLGLLSELEKELARQNRAFSWDSFGIDFWLSRNGHGAGFFDRGLNEVGDKLQAAAGTFGNTYIYENDNSTIDFY